MVPAATWQRKIELHAAEMRARRAHETNIFIARRHSDAILIRNLCSSVRPSQCGIVAKLHRQTLASGMAIILGFSHSRFFEPNRHYKIPTVKPLTCTGRLAGGRKIQHFLTEIVIYFGHGTTEVHGCCGSLTGSHRYPIDPYHVRWL